MKKSFIEPEIDFTEIRTEVITVGGDVDIPGGDLGTGSIPATD